MPKSPVAASKFEVTLYDGPAPVNVSAPNVAVVAAVFWVGSSNETAMAELAPNRATIDSVVHSAVVHMAFAVF